MNWKSVIAAALLPAVCTRAGDPPPDVLLDELRVRTLGIETVEATPETFEETVFALGRIEVLPGKKAVVSSRIPGRAFSVLAKPDMRCEQGDELIWVESRQPGEPPPTVRLDAPIAGIIASVSVAVGQPIEPNQTLVEIVDLSTVEAAAAVPEHLIGKVRKGQTAHIRLPGFSGPPFEAELAHLGASADEASGTLEAAFHVANPDEALRPGMRAEFNIIVGKREKVMSVPREALQGDPGGRFVFIRHYALPNAFWKVPVATGEQNDKFVELTSGLNAGDEVVTKGAYALAFAGKGSVSLKEAMDAAHGHPHNEDGSEMTAEQRAAAANKGGEAHGHEHDEAGGLLWKITSGVLFVLLILTTVFNRRGGPRKTGEHLALKPEPAPESAARKMSEP